MRISLSKIGIEIIRYVLPIVIIAGGVFGMMALASLKAPPGSKTAQEVSPLVELTQVQSYDRPIELSVDGEVVPYREIILPAEVAGRVIQKSDECEVGNYVMQDTLLFEIDPTDYEVEVERLEALLAQAEESIEELAVEKQNAELLVDLAAEQLALQQRDLERVKKLRDRGVSTESELETAKQNELNSRNNLLTLSNQIRLLDAKKDKLLREKDRVAAELKKAKVDLKRTKVFSPVDGVIMEELVEEDNYVSRGASLVKLEDTAKAEIRCKLRVEEIRWLWNQIDGQAPGQLFDPIYTLPNVPVKVDLNVDGQVCRWVGELSRYDGVAFDPATRTVPCLITVHQPNAGKFVNLQEDLLGMRRVPALMRGMFVELHFQVSTHEPLLSIPATALRPGSKVWQYQDGQLRIKPVKVAQAKTQTVLLYAADSGVTTGDRIITSPLPVALEGMKLRDRGEIQRAQVPASDEEPNS